MVRFYCNEETSNYFMGDSIRIYLKRADGEINYDNFYYGKVIGNTAFVGFPDCMEIYEEDEFVIKEGEIIMPNWVNTIVNFEGKQEAIDKIKKLISNENGEVDFNTLIPMPDNIFKGDLGREEREKYGENNWYDWSIAHWGTKWNACDSGNVFDSPNGIYFSTAWSFPTPFMERLGAICIVEDVKMSGYFCDEDIYSNNKGFFDNYGCSYVDEGIESEEAKEIISNCWGEDFYEEALTWSEEDD